MCIDAPDPPAPVAPPPEPPDPLQVKDQLKPSLIGKKRSPNSPDSVRGLRNDLTRTVDFGGGSIGGNLL